MGKKRKARLKKAPQVEKGKCISGCGRDIATGRSSASKAATRMGLCGSCYRDQFILSEFRARELNANLVKFLDAIEVLKKGEQTLPALNRHCGRMVDEMRELKDEVDAWTESVGQRLAYETEITAKLRELRKRVRKALNSGTAELRRAAKERHVETRLMGLDDG